MDYIGRLVEKFESGNNRCRSFSQCGPDYGLSCGTNQRILRFGVSIKFLKKYFSDEECVQKLYWNNLRDRPLNYWPGEAYCSPPEMVQAAWLHCVNKVGDKQFEEYEYEDILENYYNPCCKLLKDILDVNNISRAYQESVFSGSILYGPDSYAKLIRDVIKENEINIAMQQDKLFDLIYDKRFYDYPWNRHNRVENMTVSKDESEREVLRPYLTVSPLKKENEDMKKLCLVIDPGHYPGYNPGIDPTVCEGDVMYSLAEAEKKYCDINYSDQVDCILTRGMNEDPSLEQGRGHKAVKMKQSGNYETVMFMSDHTNAPGGNPPDPNVTGICIFTSQFRKNTYDFLQKLADVAASVMNSHFLYMDAQPLSAADPADWWGVVRGAMNHAKTQQEADQNGADYAFIIEHGFHTNPVECAFFKNQKNIQRMAEAKIDFIMEYLGIKKAATMTAFWLCDGTLEITYAGADGVNLHSGLKMVSTNVVGILYKGEKRRVVQGIKMSDGQNWYRLESGEYITANKNYVKYAENNQKKKVGKVTGIAANDVLNVRDFPNSYSGNVTRTLKEGNLVQVIGECYNNGDHWYLVDQGNAPAKFSGFVAARYVE